MADASEIATYARLLRLTPLLVAEDEPAAVKDTKQPAAPIWRRCRAVYASFLLVAVMPACLAVIYFWLLAADRYQSEARFVLRTPGGAMPNGSAAMMDLLHGSAASRSTENGYIVREFLMSRDAMAWLEKASQLAASWAEPRLDFVWRFPNPFMSDSDEGRYRQFERMVSVEFDSSTGVNTLKVQAFRAANAKQQAEELLDAAEALVNRLNERARRDAVAFAESEAARMRERNLAAQAAVMAFRARERLIDPGQATMAVLETITKLSREATQVSVQLRQLEKSSPKSPQIRALRGRHAALEAQIVIQRQRLAGDATSIAATIADYERLILEREFAEKALIAAMTAVDTARVEALRQQIYLERVATPNEPDYPTSPWRALWCLAITTAGLMTWHMWRIISGDILRHTES